MKRREAHRGDRDVAAPRSGESDLEFPGARGRCVHVTNTTSSYICSNLALFKFFNILYSYSLGFLYGNVLK